MKKIILIFFFVFILAELKSQNNVGIGTTTPDPTAILELAANNMGLLVPRVTTAQRMAILVTISSNGLLVYDLDMNCFYYYVAASGSWTSMCVLSGPTGPTGAQGPTGSNGSNGVTGAQGPTGTQGPTGPVGANGTTGAQGPTGAAGPSGINGINGVTGALGPTGPAGATGITGNAGVTGPTGDRYSTTSTDCLNIQLGPVCFTVATGLAYSVGQTVIIAYDISNSMVADVTSYNSVTGVMCVNVTSITGGGNYCIWAVNMNGAPGPAGPAGPAGPTGAAGPAGVAGATGPAGTTGAAGATGPAGTTGAAGTTGPAGTTGTAGATGAAGPTGSAGVTGPTGSFTNNAWLIVGNSGTIPGTNFIGTTDAQDFVTKTAGSLATNERLRVTTAGLTIINNTTPIAGDVFSVYGSGTTGAINALGDYAINGYSSGTGAGVYGTNSGTGEGVLGTSTSTGIGVYGDNNSTGLGVYGSSTSTGIGVYGLNDAINVAVEGDVYNAVPQNCNSGVSIGVFGYNNNTVTAPGAATGVYGMTTATTGSAYGVIGISASNTGFAIYGSNSNASGTGAFGIGNNQTGSYLTSGSGGAFTGLDGLYGLGKSVADGTGVIGVGNNETANISVLVTGSGGAFTGNDIGVYGYSVTNEGGFGGYFCNSGTAYTYVGGTFGGTDYKVNGTGNVSTIVETKEGEKVNMFCPESPEILFQDYGSGQLVNGKVHITLDPTFSNNIHVDKNYPLKVFIQLNGECNGVYVTNRSINGFDVIELQNGTSNTEFTYTVVASRKDRVVNGKVVSKHVGVRFPNAPGPESVKSVSTSETNNLFKTPDIEKLSLTKKVKKSILK